MAIIGKVERFRLPGGTGDYKIVDTVTREEVLCASIFSAEVTYSKGTYVWYPDLLLGKLYKAVVGMDVPEAWNPAKWQEIKITDELDSLRSAIRGGVAFIGITTTLLYDGSTAETVVINGTSRTAESGNLVIQEWQNYATNVGYAKGVYLKYDGDTYKSTSTINKTENTSWNAVKSKFQEIKVTGNIEFLYDGEIWNELGAGSAFGTLAYKNSASGSFTLQTESKTATYTKPTGSGTVSVNTYEVVKKQIKATATNGTVGANGTANAITGFGTHPSDTVHDTPTPTTSKLVTTTIYGVKSTTQNVSKVTAASATEKVAIANGTDKVYGTADVGASVSVATDLSGTTTFVKNALKSASLTGTTSFATSGLTASVSNGCLTFANVTNATVGLSTTDCGSGDKGTVSLQKTNITPAVAAPTTQVFTPVTSTTTIKGINTINNYDVALKATDSTTVSTGALDSTGTGATVMTGINAGSEKTFLTGLGTPTTAAALTGVKVTAQPTVTLSLSNTGTSTVDVVTGLTAGTESKSVTVGTENGSISVTVPKTTGSVTVQ